MLDVALHHELAGLPIEREQRYESLGRVGPRAGDHAGLDRHTTADEQVRGGDCFIEGLDCKP